MFPESSGEHLMKLWIPEGILASCLPCYETTPVRPANTNIFTHRKALRCVCSPFPTCGRLLPLCVNMSGADQATCGRVWHMLTWRHVCVFQCHSPRWYKLHLAQSPSMAPAVRKQKTHDIVDHSCLSRSKLLFAAEAQLHPPNIHSLSKKIRFCYVTKQRDSWKTYCGSQSWS